MVGFEKLLGAVKVIKDQIQYRSQSLLNLAHGYFSNQNENSFLRSRGICIPNLSFLCLKMAEIETFILLPWLLIYPSNHTQKLLLKSTVTSIPILGLLHLQTADT